jgi:hypothetical protein
VVAADFDIGGVQPDIRPITLDRPGEEGMHALIDLAAQAGDLAFAYPSGSGRLPMFGGGGKTGAL